MSDKILPFSKVATTPANDEPVPAKVELLLADSFGDPETLLNSRDWLRRALESRRAKIVDGGVGCGQADLDIELDGCAFNVSIRPIARGK